MQPQILLKLVALILLQCFTTTLLFAQTPASSTQPDNSAVNFPEASAYSNANLTYQIIDAPNNTYVTTCMPKED
jgi:hypothetical protein